MSSPPEPESTGENSRPGTVECSECGNDFQEGNSFCGSCGHQQAEVDKSATPGPGSIIGAYRILELIGEGGMGIVFLAEHNLLGRKVALKMVRPEVAHVPGLVERFFAEARAVNQILHEHIVEITDFVQEGTSDNYYIMEHLRGEDLAALLEREPKLPIARAINICEQVADAMAAVHAAKTIHRDLKPDNVFLTERGGKKDYVKLLDFGIAKLADASMPEGTNKHKTSAGAVLGTPEFMSPEQSGGKTVSHLTDVYALGVIMYRAVAGRVPFVAESFGELLMMQMIKAPPPIDEVRGDTGQVPDALDALIMRCLAKDPAERPQTMMEIRYELLDIAESIGSDAGRTTTTTDPDAMNGETPAQPETQKKKPALLLGAGAAAVAIAAAAVLMMGGSDKKEDPKTAATEPIATAVQPVVSADASALALRPIDAGLPDAAPPMDASPPDAGVPDARVRTPKVSKVPVSTSFGMAAIDTSPYTTVYQGRKRLGDTPLRVKLPVGRVTLTLINRGAGIKETVTVNVQKGKTVVKKLKL